MVFQPAIFIMYSIIFQAVKFKIFDSKIHFSKTKGDF